MTRSTIRLARIVGGLIVGALVLSGCSDGSKESGDAAGSQAAEPSTHNAADLAFVQGMLPHHAGALTMSQLADGRAADSRVVDLADRIETAQGPEIDTMTGWLEEWGEPLPEENTNGMHRSAEGMDMSGMSEDERAMLDSASGPEFDRMFLQMMIPHHQGALDMAETEIADGADADAVALARDIVGSQRAEIGEMQTLLTELGG